MLSTIGAGGVVRVTGASTIGKVVFINTEGNFLNPTMFVPGKSAPQVLDAGTGLRGKQWGCVTIAA